MYQYDAEAYRQLHHEKTAQLRSDFQRPQEQRRSNVAERGARFIRSVRLRHKLVTIGILVAALAAPAIAAGKGIRLHHARVQIACPQIIAGRPYGMCGGRIWVRDPHTGQFKAISFWTLQHMDDQHLADRP
jgi:hypothetical protein